MTMNQIPVLKVGPVLLVSIQTELNDRAAIQMQESILKRIEETAPSGLLMDISSLVVVDSFVGRILTETAAMAQIMNTQTVLVGMMPEVAITLTEMGLSLPELKTAMTVELGLEALGYQFQEIDAVDADDGNDNRPLVESTGACP